MGIEGGRTGAFAQFVGGLVLKLLLGLKGVGGNLLVVLLQSSEIFTSLGELAFLHTLTNIPVDESALAVHEVELEVKARPGLGDGGGVGQHGDGAVDSGKTTVLGGSRDGHGLLVVDTELEAGRAPLNEVEGSLGLDGSDGSGAVTGDNITTVQKGDSHVLSVSGVADDHLVVGLKACKGTQVRKRFMRW